MAAVPVLPGNACSNLQRGKQGQDFRQGDRFHAGGEREPVLPGVDDEGAVELQVGAGDVQGFGHAGRGAGLEFYTDAFAVQKEQEVQFRAAMGAPEISRPGVGGLQDLLHGKAFPRGSGFRMPQEAGPGWNIQQGVQQAAVPDVNLGGFGLTLADVFMPWRQPPDDLGTGEEVKIVTQGFIVGTEGAGEFGAVPGLTVIVGQHGPEPEHGFGTDGDPGLGQIPFQKGSDEILPPTLRGGFADCQKRTGKSAAHPERLHLSGSGFFDAEAGDVHQSGGSGEGFGGPFDECNDEWWEP